MDTNQTSLSVRRVSISLFFFFYGFIFATWASRIPAIQQRLHLSNAGLGLVLLGMPVGSFIALPFSGFATSKYGSRIVLIISSITYCILLAWIGFLENSFLLAFCLFLFGATGNMVNIAVNTQAIALETSYKKTIISSFHGMWSVAGLAAASLANIFIAKSFAVRNHFLIASLASLLIFISVSPFLLNEEKKQYARRSFFTRPGKELLALGMIAFCSLICQGAMFDWSGIYFKKIVTSNPALTGLGYTAFMISMTSVRFITDWLNNRIGFKKIIILCGIFITAGLLLAIVFPFLVTATIGIFLVGIGVSPAVPLVFSAAGKFKHMPTPVAIAAVSSIGMIGLLIGPPMVGFIAGFTSLKMSFLILSFFGMAIIVTALKGKIEA
ncbi:MAG: MFS transporter [Ginsengibacter sp.]